MGPAQKASQQERLHLLFEALETLPEDYQRIIDLRDFEGLALKEVARRMSRSVTAVTHLHNRAILKLGAVLRNANPASENSWGAGA